MIKTLLSIAFVVSSLTACGQNPLAPPAPTVVTLSMTVMGSTTQAPIKGATVILVDANGRGDVRVTNADGRAAWLVEPNRSYTVSVCGMSGPFALVTQDAGWLTSLPESYCEGK